MQIIIDYFPNLTSQQIQNFTDLEDLYRNWNTKVNLISRKDIDSLYIKHILHSLAISKVVHFKSNTTILDAGTGGGFPGIPLAILFPEVNFLLVDSIKKKINVVNDIIKTLGLKNVLTRVSRVEDLTECFDFVVSRAVTNMGDFRNFVKGRFNAQHNNSLRNGILYLKGGNLQQELKGINHTIYDISSFYKEDFFETKKIVYIAY